MKKSQTIVSIPLTNPTIKAPAMTQAKRSSINHSRMYFMLESLSAAHPQFVQPYPGANGRIRCSPSRFPTDHVKSAFTFKIHSRFKAPFSRALDERSLRSRVDWFFCCWINTFSHPAQMVAAAENWATRRKNWATKKAGNLCFFAIIYWCLCAPLMSSSIPFSGY